MGWSAFAGYLVLFASWPLNSLIMKRAISIQKGFATARDRRMSVMNELVGAVSKITDIQFAPIGLIVSAHRSSLSSSSLGKNDGSNVHLRPVKMSSSG